ncbi:MAG: type IX secretion system membrane protein PorP/SprF [Paramuribaculum sp.]|nr:type IX secretion system membrane protein PorP/SprF [Paramuribaculum sp.]
MSDCRRHILSLCLAITAIVTTSLACGAQTDAQLSQYYETPSYYNPAAIGNTDMVHIRAGSRLQWVGIDNAPKTFLATADMPVKIGNRRIAVGLTANSESAGLFSNLSVNLQAAYKFKLLKGVMTAGVQLGFANEVFRGSDVFIPDGDDFHEPTDDAIPRTDVSGNAFDVGAGVFYSHRYFWAGVSATHLTAPTITFSDSQNSSGGSSSTDATRGNYEFQLRRTLYFMAGGNIPIKNTLFEVLPSLMVKSDFQFTRAELTGRMRYKKLFSFGIGYRHDDAVIATFGVEIKGFYVGYSYDYPVSAISKASSGSHEIIAGYNLKLNLSDKNKNKHKSIRIM